jgi:hypothetical protein
VGVITFQIKERAIVPDPFAEFGGRIAQRQDVAQSRVEGELIQRPVEATAIIQPTPSRYTS